jgi:hypothetical protein
MTTTLITGTYEKAAEANRAVQALIEAEFDADDISVVIADRVGVHPVEVSHDSGIGGGAKIGAALGAALGAIGATLVATGVLAAPGLGVWATGPVLAALRGAVAGGSVGIALGAAAGLGVWKDSAHLHAEDLKGGSVLIGVHADGARIEKARELLRGCGAVRITG